MPKSPIKTLKKKKYNARFPPARIKKIMQTDEEVGKVAAAVPVIISRALEMFIEGLITETAQTTMARNAKTLSTSHIKHTIESQKKFDFLKDLVADLPDHQVEESNGDAGTDNDLPQKKGRGRPRKNKDAPDIQKRKGHTSKSTSDTSECDNEEEEEDDEETETDEEVHGGSSSVHTHQTSSHQITTNSFPDRLSPSAENISHPSAGTNQSTYSMSNNQPSGWNTSNIESETTRAQVQMSQHPSNHHSANSSSLCQQQMGHRAMMHHDPSQHHHGAVVPGYPGGHREVSQVPPIIPGFSGVPYSMHQPPHPSSCYPLPPNPHHQFAAMYHMMNQRLPPSFPPAGHHYPPLSHSVEQQQPMNLSYTPRPHKTGVDDDDYDV